MVTTSETNSFPISASRHLLTYHRVGLCHVIRMPWNVGKKVILVGEFAASPKSQSPTDKAEVKRDIV